ncbi:MAG: hypothetical protein KDB21_03675 [Acidimicrobiales bacterium]|nr:hypothetical protein [Acidimicrobiales bacterium]
MRGGPTITHLDDLDWHDVARQRLADGRVVSIREKWFELGPRYVVFYSRWDPGALGPLHGHTGDHSVFILEGEITVGDVVCRAGSHLMLEWGDMFGPMEAGAEGCLMYGVVAGNARPFLRSNEWAAFLAERGAEELPVAFPEMPAHLGPDTPLVNPTE